MQSLQYTYSLLELARATPPSLVAMQTRITNCCFLICYLSFRFGVIAFYVLQFDPKFNVIFGFVSPYLSYFYDHFQKIIIAGLSQMFGKLLECRLTDGRECIVKKQ